jgi:hypothetical protein
LPVGETNSVCAETLPIPAHSAAISSNRTADFI